MADRSIYAPPARLFAGDSWAWEIADPAAYPSAAHVLTYALTPEAGGALVEVEAEAPSPSRSPSRSPRRHRRACPRPLALVADGDRPGPRNPRGCRDRDFRGPGRSARPRPPTPARRRAAFSTRSTRRSRARSRRTPRPTRSRAGRSPRIPLPELMAARDRYAAIVRREDGAGPIAYRPMRFADDVSANGGRSAARPRRRRGGPRRPWPRRPVEGEVEVLGRARLQGGAPRPADRRFQLPRRRGHFEPRRNQARLARPARALALCRAKYRLHSSAMK